MQEALGLSSVSDSRNILLMHSAVELLYDKGFLVIRQVDCHEFEVMPCCDTLTAFALLTALCHEQKHAHG